MKASRKLAKAVSNYEMWHQRRAKKITKASFSFPGHVSKIGRAIEILYRSDKFETDGKFYDYSHTFDSRPFVYGQDGSSDEDAVSGELSLPLLGTVKWLLIKTASGEETLTFPRGTILSCSSDRKTVIILNKGDPLFVRGGKMVVTKRGIVN